MEDFEDRIDTVNNVLSLFVKVGVAFGGAVFLLYCLRIGYFPQDVSISDGLLFLLLAVVFGVLYLLFLVCLTSLGLALRPAWCGIYKCIFIALRGYNKVTGKSIALPSFSLDKLRVEFYFFALLGVWFIVGFSFTDIYALITLPLCTWGCALMWTAFQNNRRKIMELDDKLYVKLTDNLKLKSIEHQQSFIIIMVLILPLLISGVTGKLLDGAMRLANIRNDAATVHVKDPYANYISAYGLKGEKSSFGPDFAKFDGIPVLFSGFGKNVVIELTSPAGAVSFAIPSDSIYLIKENAH
ncbi:MAG TPA: hypothetical protein VGI71_18065 [Scandinavium sp.]|jgi:hypothetical protein